MVAELPVLIDEIEAALSCGWWCSSRLGRTADLVRIASAPHGDSIASDRGACRFVAGSGWYDGSGGERA
jgi:hypothetical protein